MPKLCSAYRLVATPAVTRRQQRVRVVANIQLRYEESAPSVVAANRNTMNRTETQYRSPAYQWPRPLSLIFIVLLP